MERKRKIFKPVVENDLGIGNQVVTHSQLIDKDGKFKVERRGVNLLMHPYQKLIEMSWTRFHLLIIAFYISINFFFALLYVLIGEEALSGEYHGNVLSSFFRSYFFSVQTFTTVGYGSLAPMTFASNVVAAIEALFGLLIFALATGLYYAKFTRPTAKIKFSDIAVVAPFKDEINAFMFRIVNHSTSQLIEMEAIITFSWLQKDENGIMRRAFRQVTLERQKVALFPLNWTIVHPIDENSPLWGKSFDELKEMNAEFVIFIKGQDITFGQMIQANRSYSTNNIKWAEKFVPMYYSDAEKGTVIELNKINETVNTPLFDTQTAYADLDNKTN
ncbi:MAG: ion channel [Saprospiraceae bacterium]